MTLLVMVYKYIIKRQKETGLYKETPCFWGFRDANKSPLLQRQYFSQLICLPCWRTFLPFYSVNILVNLLVFFCFTIFANELDTF
jgi:hypothetical protein